MAEEEIRTGKNPSKNYWMFSTLVLAAILIIILIFRFTSPVTGNVIKEDAAGQAILDFAEQQGIQATLVSVTDTGSLYEVVINIEGQDAPIYITKDGKNLVSGVYPLTEQATANTNTQTQRPASYSEEDLIKLKEFNECLATKRVKIYGANWCGWTKKLVVETLGGFETAKAVYVECTEEEALCSNEEVSGYPTIKINGKVYSGERTIKAIAEATGCPAPSLTGTAATTTENPANCDV